MKISALARTTLNEMIEECDGDYFEVVTEYEHMGLCVDCGALRDRTEPDATNYPCEECGDNSVFGLEQVLLFS